MSTFMLGLLINLPFIVAVIATAVVWRTIHRQLLFLVAAALSLLGVKQRVEFSTFYSIQRR